MSLKIAVIPAQRFPKLKYTIKVETKLKLYCATGACSIASHIALIEVGVDYELESIDLFGASTTSDGRQFREINPKGFVPVLEISPGLFLTENIAILQFIADQNPALKLAPKSDSMERYRLQEWLGFINSDLHRSFTPLFRTSTPKQSMVIYRAKINAYLDYIERVLESRRYLIDSNFTVADCYLFTVLNWSESVCINLSKWPAIANYYCNIIHGRESVRAALEWDGNV